LRVARAATTRVVLDGVPDVGAPLCVTDRPSPLVPCREGWWAKPGLCTITLVRSAGYRVGSFPFAPRPRARLLIPSDAAVATGAAKSGARCGEARAGQIWRRGSRGSCRRFREPKREPAWRLDHASGRPLRRAQRILCSPRHRTSSNSRVEGSKCGYLRAERSLPGPTLRRCLKRLEPRS